MSEALGKIVEELIGLFKRNYKRPRLCFFVVVIIFVCILFLPYIDSNFFYFTRIEKRIEILEKVMALEQDVINTSQMCKGEYQDILQEIENQRELDVDMLVNNLFRWMEQVSGPEKGNRWIQFLTGAFWFFLLVFWIPFMKTFKKRTDKILAFFRMVFLAIVVGSISCIIPIFVSPVVNYIGVPLVQLLIAVIIVVRSDKSKKEVKA